MAFGVHHNQTQEQLTARLTGKDPDCCFCDTLSGRDKVTSHLAQTYINDALNTKKPPEGICGPVKWGCTVYLPDALSCKKMHQEPTAFSDSSEERIKRCACSCLGCTVCAPCAAAKLYRADTQAQLLLAPDPQTMK